MNKTLWLWLVLAVIYGAFFSWYTSFGGPLTEEEIEKYIKLFDQGEAPAADRENMIRFMREDTGDDFAMLNVIHYYDKPLQIEGVDPSMTTEEVQAKYMQYMTPQLFARASHPVFLGTAAASAVDIMNAEGMEYWTDGALMRYRSRRDVLEISANFEFVDAHKFKVAAMAKTIAFPNDPWFHLGDPRLLLALFLALIGTSFSWLFSSRSNQ